MKINDALTRTITTIVEGLIKKAGFNRTRSGQIVGINPQTNTYDPVSHPAIVPIALFPHPSILPEYTGK